VLLSTMLMFALTVFSAATPDFRCRVPACDVINASYDDAFSNHFDNFTVPGNDRCYQFRFRGSSNETSPEEQCVPDNFASDELVECSDWIFDKSVYSTTFMSEAGIVCQDDWKGPLAQSLVFVGALLASLITGLLADKFGRRHVTMTCVFVMNVSSLGMIFVSSYELYAFLLFMIGGAQAGLFLVAFILAMEMVEAEKRVICGIVLEVVFNLSEILAAGLAFWLRDWRIVVVVGTVPSFFFLLFWPVLPESVRCRCYKTFFLRQ
jgi:OCT family organic cation transporter-like MFS transporter 4/5